MQHPPFTLLTAALLCALLSPFSRAADWPQFRGPNRDGVSADTKVPVTWSRDQNVKWKAPLPQPGNSSPVVSGDRVFVTCAEDAKGNDRSLYCFSRADGKKLWSRTERYAKSDPTHARNPYCASTPAADGSRVIVWHGSAGVFCYDYDGKPLWHRDLGEFRHIWGYASSPALYEEAVLLNCGPGPRSFVIALDRKTGQTLWQTDEPGGAEDKDATGNWLGSWASPVIAKVAGHDQILLPQPRRVKAYDPKSGKVLWTCGGTGPLSYADVMVGDNVAVAASGYGGPTIGFKLAPPAADAKDAKDAKEAKASAAANPAGPAEPPDLTDANRLWRMDRNPQRIGTGVVRGPHLYVVNEPGFFCIEMSTGHVLWKHLIPNQIFWASLVFAEDRLYATSQSGTTFVFAADPKEYRQLATNEMGEGSNSALAVSDGQLFLRTFKSLYCIEGK